MVVPPSANPASVIAQPAARVTLAAALGLLVGIEREWASKTVGVRTFPLVSLLGAVFTTVFLRWPAIGAGLVVVGAAFVVSSGALLALRGVLREESLSVTTTASLLVVYGVGTLVATGQVWLATVVTVVAVGLLIARRELHSLAGRLSRRELRSVTEFALVAFVIYPVLPAGERVIAGVAVEPRVVWALVVAVAGIGGVNYLAVASYDGRAVAVTGLLGGLVSSTAVVGTMLDQLGEARELTPVAVAATLLANGSMAGRNLAIVVAFTLPIARPAVIRPVVPLLVLAVACVVAALAACDWRTPAPIELESPFSLRNAVGFGVVFAAVVVTTGFAESEFGATGLYLSAIVSGVVSSAGATTSAVVLYRSGTIGAGQTGTVVLLATAASVVVKVGLAAAGPRLFRRQVTVYSAVVLALSGAVATVTALG